VPTVESSVIEVGEAAIYVERRGSGPPVLLLHGFPETLAMWRDVAPLLAERFSVVCADLRGYGGSGCPPLAIWRELADDVTGRPVEGGHFFPEEHPQATAHALAAFFPSADG
jgi:pimeloyl-ACP methyl ester carboxylesterase